jgi:type VI secretion system secreted protein VgrG
MGKTKQGERLLSLTTPLGPDVLLLTCFSGGEGLSRLFTYQLDLISENPNIKPADIVGKNVTWEVDYIGGEARYFNGYVSNFTGSGTRQDKMRVYHAEVVPWLWFLSRTADCKIFQNRTAPQIIQMVFDDLNKKVPNFVQYSPKLTRTDYPTREYCVQYRETAFNFVSRLMEQEGIFYYFKHEKGKHTLITGDAASAYYDCTEKNVNFSTPPGGPGLVTGWNHQYSFRSGKWTQNDYNFLTPQTSLLNSTPTIVKQPGEDAYELFDYPGEYLVKGDGKKEVDVRMQEEEAPYNVVTGGGGCTTFSPGAKFSLKRHAVAAEQGDYVLLAVDHHAREFGYSDSTAGGQYDNTFTCIPASVLFRPPRLTPKSIVQGPQTAIVVGPKDEEIYTDDYGRIKVQFFWDRYGKWNEESTCFIRVAQIWAGKNWGASFWPRIGQEVVVDFLEGDPDRPLVTGSVYNAFQMPPYQGSAPDSKHVKDNKVCGIKSNTTKGGEGYNEWRFDDTKGKEEIFIHGQRDMDTRILNDNRMRIFGNEHWIVGYEKDGKKGGDHREKIYQDLHVHLMRHQVEHVEGNVQFLVGKGSADDGGKVDISIEKDQKELIGGNYDLHVKGNLTAGVDGAENLSVGGDRLEAVKGKSHLHVTGDLMEKVDGGLSVTVGGDQQTKTGGKANVDAAQEIHLKAGQKVILEASTMISLVVGGNFITIDSSGVSIVGTMVNINSGGSAGSGSGSSPTAPQDASAPQDAEDAKPTDPDLADDSKSGLKSSTYKYG